MGRAALALWAAYRSLTGMVSGASGVSGRTNSIALDRHAMAMTPRSRGLGSDIGEVRIPCVELLAVSCVEPSAFRPADDRSRPQRLKQAAQRFVTLRSVALWTPYRRGPHIVLTTALNDWPRDRHASAEGWQFMLAQSVTKSPDARTRDLGDLQSCDRKKSRGRDFVGTRPSPHTQCWRSPQHRNQEGVTMSLTRGV
jgi:hypothetical protein